jgi:2-polyprenyl-3-methyl-5-hydroxy-6-metoxy-1,4-benzoquinol methylase
MRCKICGNQVTRIFAKQLLGKHDVAYFQCASCSFIQTEDPYWLDEAYSSAISDLDLGPVNRAITGAKLTEGVILAGFDPNGKFIDWGGGYGIFTRLMRDLGYDFYWSDRHCQNLFAKQFVANTTTAYELMTCFEVFEHLVQPMEEIGEMVKFSANILFTTLLHMRPPNEIETWWYLAPEHGQHVSLYNIRSLQAIAKTSHLHLNSDGVGTHLLSRNPFPECTFKLITRNGLTAALLRRLRRRRFGKDSLLMRDFRDVTRWYI